MIKFRADNQDQGIIDIKFPAPRAYLLGASVHISLIVFLLAPLPAFEQTPETASPHQCQPPAPAQAAPGPPLLAAVCAADPRLAPEPRGPGGWRCINSGSERSAAQSDSGRQHVHISQHGRVQTIQTQIPRDGERQVRVPVCQPLPSVPPQPVQHGSASSDPGQA